MFSKIKIIVSALIFTIITLSASYASYKFDPFSQYRNFIKRPLAIKAKQLKYYNEEEKLIRAKLKLDLSQRERVILAGLHWMICFIDDDSNFDGLFADFMLFMQTMTHSHGRQHQKEVAQSIVRTSLARAQNKLDKLFETNEESRWRLLGIFYILAQYPEFQDSYFNFYKTHYKSSNLEEPFEFENTKFADALKAEKYQVLFVYLVQTSFLHYYLALGKNQDFVMPKDKFGEYLKEFESFNYNLNYSAHDPEFRQLGYLATHIPLVLTNYGEFNIKDGVNKDKVQAYIEATFDKVKNSLGDFDLFAEYVQCLKILNPGRDPRIKDLEKFIYSLQRPDGSWGSERDFTTNPYTAIHPGGAALMALNQPDTLMSPAQK